MTSVCRCLVIILALVIYSEGRALEQCRDQTVLEGETGMLAFPLRRDINAPSNTVHANLRRAKRPEHNIMSCDQHSPLECTVNDPADRNRSGIWRHELLLHIPNMSKELEDTYTLKIYVNGTFEVQSCNLTVQSKPSSRTCSASSVIEGDTGVMTFFIRQDLLASYDGFSATLTQNGGQGEILTCRRFTSSSYVECIVLNKYFQTDGFTQDHLRVFIPNIKKDFEGLYTLRISADSTNTSPEFCLLQVKDVPADTKSHTENAVTQWIFYAIAIVLCIIAAVVVSPHVRGIGNFLFRPCGLRWTAKVNKEGEISVPLLRLTDTKSHQNKRWFHDELSDEAEEKLVQSKCNGPGSFLVKVSRTNHNHFILAVLLKEGMKYLTIIPKKKRLVCPSLSREPFDTLCDLVDYYKKHEIRVNNKVWGTLSKPFESEPEGNWYFGQLARRHVERILKENGSGSFLITVSNTDEDGYDLSVNFNDEALHFGIIAEDDCFRMLDTYRTYKTLSEFVDYYKYNDLVVNESTNYTRLRNPCAKEPDNVMSCESFSEVATEFVYPKRTRPGTFLITRNRTHSGSPEVQRDRHSCDGTTSDIYELVVYFENTPTRFPFRRERNGFMFPATNMFFYSCYELVDFYHSNEIKVGDKVWGKLSQPFRKDPEDDWYFGPLRREDERELLMSEKYGPGSFLIRDCISDPDHYTLAMRYNGDIVHHRLIPTETGFSMLHTAVEKETLPELVQHFQDHEVELVDGTTHGKLSGECTKDPPDDWYFKTLTTEEKNMFQQKALPGSFLITNHRTSHKTYTLLVYFEGTTESLKVKRDRNGFTFLTTELFFYSLYELVAHYKEHDIKVGDKQIGKLWKAFRKVCMEKWFAGPLTREDETKLLLSGENGPGSYLVRDGISDRNNYVLAVNFAGKVENFTIISKDSRFKMLDTDRAFPTLTELVNHYRSNNIKVDDRIFGKLIKPFTK